MSKSIIQSIKPQYCELIASGKKTIEVRKTRPKLDVPFKVYIYCTKDKEIFYQSRYRKNFISYKPKFYKDTETLLKQNGHTVFNGKVIGEYVCDVIYEYSVHKLFDKDDLDYIVPQFHYAKMQLTQAELLKYGQYKDLYGYHISDLKIYDKPKELGEFFGACKQPKGTDCSVCRDNREHTCKSLTHPPQSWCYVEEV